MTPLNFGPGLAPAVTMVHGRVYVAFGVQTEGDVPAALHLVVVTPAGEVLTRIVLGDGFFNSFPRFSGPWLVYKRNHDWRPAAIQVETWQKWIYRGQADGNFGVVVNAALNLVAYQWTTSYAIWLGSLLDGDDAPTSQRGAPDGLADVIVPGRVTLRKDTRASVPGLWYPVRAGDLIVGELLDDPRRPTGGVAVQLADDELRVALAGQDTPTPSCAMEGETYAIVTGGPHGVRLLLGPRADLVALPPAAPIDRVPGPMVHVPPAADPALPDPVRPPPVPAPADPVPPYHPGPTPTSASPFVTVHAFTLGGSMQTERGGLRGPQGKFLRVIPGTQGQGMWPDSFKVACDADAPTGDAEWEITQLEGGDAGHFSIRSVPNGECYFGADAGKFSTDACHQYYTAPRVRGALEKPYGVTWPNGSKVLACVHDEGNVTAPLTWVKA